MKEITMVVTNVVVPTTPIRLKTTAIAEVTNPATAREGTKFALPSLLSSLKNVKVVIIKKIANKIKG